MKILVVGPSWVGDMVMAQSLFKCLLQRHPGAQIDVLAPAFTRPLLDRMPEVRAALDMPVGHGQLALAARYRLGKSLARRGYDQAIVLPNSFKSALVPYFAGIPERTGWRGEARGMLLNDCRLLDKLRYPRMVQRFAALAWPANASLPDKLPDPRLKPSTHEDVLTRHAVNLQRSVLVLCPGAEFGEAKQWPAGHFARVAHAVVELGLQVWLMGSGNDRQIADAIMTDLPVQVREHCRNLVGATSLAEAVDLLGHASGVVSNDSGLMHIAAALGKPVVVVYGSTSPDFTPPLTEFARTLSLALPCSPCFKRICPLGHLRCLRDLESRRVITALAELSVLPADKNISVCLPTGP
jgi:heptosyltransferase II